MQVPRWYIDFNCIKKIISLSLRVVSKKGDISPLLVSISVEITYDGTWREFFFLISIFGIIVVLE